MMLQRPLQYVAECCRYLSAADCGPASLFRDFPRWLRAGHSRYDLLDAGMPWVTFAAIRYLDRILTPSSRVFEYGSGGSTLYFATRTTAVQSVEHDAEWCERVRAAITARGIRNACVTCIPPEANALAEGVDVADPDAYASSDARHRRSSFYRYASAIAAYPPDSFDLVLIDGRARPSCAKHAWERVAPGGTLVLDNSERAAYSTIAALLRERKWELRSFSGPGPGTSDFWQTSFWRRRPDAPARTHAGSNEAKFQSNES